MSSRIWLEQHRKSQLPCVHATGHSLQSARGSTGQNVLSPCVPYLNAQMATPGTAVAQTLAPRPCPLKSADGMLPALP